MGLLKCLKSMHTLFECTLLHVQVPIRDVVMPMAVEKDSNPFSKIFKKLSLEL